MYVQKCNQFLHDWFKFPHHFTMSIHTKIKIGNTKCESNLIPPNAPTSCTSNEFTLYFLLFIPHSTTKHNSHMSIQLSIIIKVVPLIFIIWPCNNISHIQDYLFTTSQASPITWNWNSTRSKFTNRKPFKD
jgi:hypothetical protein